MQNMEKARRKPGPRKRYRRKMTALLIIEIILALILCCAIYGQYYISNMWSNVQTVVINQDTVETNSLSDKTVMTQGEYTMFVIFGVDARSNDELTKDANADTIIICSINNETHELRLVSVLRDSYLETSKGKWGKINNHYAAYGVAETISTLNRNFDLSLSDYVTVNWKAVAQIVELMGGVDIDMEEAEADAINDYIYDIMEATGLETERLPDTDHDGVYHLNGVQTVAYARIRSVGEHDIGRAQRQRTVITLLLEKAKTMDLSKLNQIAQIVLPGMSTSFSLDEVLELIDRLMSIDIDKTTGVPFDDYYLDEQGGDYYVYYDTLAENVIQLHEFLFDVTDYTPTDEIYELSEEILGYAQDNP